MNIYLIEYFLSVVFHFELLYIAIIPTQRAKKYISFENDFPYCFSLSSYAITLPTSSVFNLNKKEKICWIMSAAATISFRTENTQTKEKFECLIKCDLKFRKRVKILIKDYGKNVSV